MKMSAHRSPKVAGLMRRSGLRTREAVGTLELLWLFAMEQAPRGNVGKWSDEDIEAACDWDGDPGGLVAALVASGWLDRCADERLTVHDWIDHAPRFLKERWRRDSDSMPLPVTLPAASDAPCHDVAQRGDSNAMPSHAKPSHAKPRGVGDGASAPAQSSKPRKRKAGTPWEPLTSPQRASLQATFPKMRAAAILYAVETVREWAEAQDHRRVDWVAVCRKAIRQGWALEGYEPVGAGEPPRPIDWDAVERKQIARREERDRRRGNSDKSKATCIAETQTDPAEVADEIAESLAEAALGPQTGERTYGPIS